MLSVLRAHVPSDDTPELNRLKERMKDAKALHVTLGPKAASWEEVAGQVNRALDEMGKRGCADQPPMSNRPKVNLK